jgi:Tfp pilus assembly major pilin PilA
MDALPEAPANSNLILIIGIILLIAVLAGAYYVKVYKKKKVSIAKPEVKEVPETQESNESHESQESEKPKEN